MMNIRSLVLSVSLLLAANQGAWAGNLDQVQHIIVISLENHSFDNIFGQFPGADNLANASKTELQTDKKGKPYTILPPVMNTDSKPPVIDKRFPVDLPNKPFPIDLYITQHDETGDLVHRFYQEQAQIDHGKMDRFAAISDAGGLTMGYYDGSKTKLWQTAQHYMLADHFFHAAFGGSFLNHFWLVCSCSPKFDHAPASIVAVLDKQGQLIKDGGVTPDGYAVNTLYSVSPPYPAWSKPAERLPAQTQPTIGDRLSDKHISWAWYSGGWNDAEAGHPDKSFQFHHQPFTYFQNYAQGTKARIEHLKDESDFVRQIDDGTLPSVAFYKPLGEFNLHPGYTDITSGDEHIADLLHHIEASSIWKNSVVIITFDENGGSWDHVPPPVIDRFGPGSRVPTIIMSPFVKPHSIDHTVYDTTSILKLIETRFDLAPLGSRDAAANNIAGALVF